MNVLRCVYALGCLLFCASFSSAGALITPNTANVTVQTGETISVGAIVGSITDLYAFQFDWRFDPKVLSPVSVTEGPFLGQGGPTSFVGGLFDDVNGVIAGTADSLTGPIKGVSGSGRLATASFTAIASGSTTLSIVNEIALDSNLNLIPEPGVVMWLLAAFAVLGYFAVKRRGDIRSRSSEAAHSHACLANAIALGCAVGSSILLAPTVATAQTPPFNQCEAVGNSASCRILILIDAQGSLRVLTDPNAGATYDGVDDTLIGVLNLSPNAIASIPLRGNGPIFGFDGDGICSNFQPQPAQCPNGPTGYEGPGVGFSNISADKTSGVVNFTPPLAPRSGHAFFGLEQAITTQCGPITPPEILKQTDSRWTAKTLGPPATSKTTIGDYGCFLTDLAMEVNYYAQKQGSTFRTDPILLNDFLVANNAFTADALAGILFSKLPLVADYARSNGVVFFFTGMVDHRDDFVLDQYLCNGQAPMLWVGDPHWVVATGQTVKEGNNTYSDIDPDTWPDGDTLKAWNYSYKYVALFSDTQAMLAGLYVVAHSPVELMITAPDGAQTGFNPVTQVRISSIPSSSYTINQLVNDQTHGAPLTPEIKELGITGASAGNYDLQLFGVGTGPYTLDITSYNSIGQSTTQTVAGTTIPGVITRFSLQYSDVPGSQTTITSFCPGDVNSDGVVDLNDVAVVKAAFGSLVGSKAYNSAADINHDGKVDIFDLAFVSKQVGCTTTTTK